MEWGGGGGNYTPHATCSNQLGSPPRHGQGAQTVALLRPYLDTNIFWVPPGFCNLRKQSTEHWPDSTTLIKCVSLSPSEHSARHPAQTQSIPIRHFQRHETERKATGPENEQGSALFQGYTPVSCFFVKHAQLPAGVFTLGSNLAHGAAAGGAAPAEGFLGSIRGIFISGGTCNRDSGNIVVSTVAQYNLQRRVDTAVGKFSDWLIDYHTYS